MVVLVVAAKSGGRREYGRTGLAWDERRQGVVRRDGIDGRDDGQPRE